MRLLFLSHSPNDPHGGASRVYHLLADGLRARGHAVQLFHEEDVGLPRGRLRGLLARRTRLPERVSAFAGRLDLAGVDAVMASSGMAAPLFAGLRGRADRPLLVHHLHGLAVYDFLATRAEQQLGHAPANLAYRLVTGPFQERWDAAGTRTADLTVVQNRRDEDQVAAALPPGRLLRFIPPAVHPELLDASATVAPLAGRAPELVWFASWQMRKGAHYVPGVLRRVRARRPEVRLTIGGTGRAGARLLELFAPEDRAAVTVLPFIDMAAQQELFNRAAVVLFPSLSEGFGLALAEAMCFGLAAVAGPTGFAADFLRDREHARLCLPWDTSIADAVLDLVEDADLRVRVAAAGRDLARRFTLARMVDGYEAAFAEGLAARR